jgi:hypothetical protein
VELFGYLCATWSKAAPEQTVPKPLKRLVGDVGLEPTTR